MNRRQKTYLAFFLLIICLIFSLQNYGAIEIKFLIWSYQTSKTLIIFSALFVGALLGWIMKRP